MGNLTLNKKTGEIPILPSGRIYFDGKTIHLGTDEGNKDIGSSGSMNFTTDYVSRPSVNIPVDSAWHDIFEIILEDPENDMTTNISNSYNYVQNANTYKHLINLIIETYYVDIEFITAPMDGYSGYSYISKTWSSNDNSIVFVSNSAPFLTTEKRYSYYYSLPDLDIGLTLSINENGHLVLSGALYISGETALENEPINIYVQSRNMGNSTTNRIDNNIQL